MTEASQTRLFLRQWRLAYPTGVAIKFNDRSTAGLTDAVLLNNARATWVEFKVDGEPLRPLQATFHRMLHRAGATVWTIWFHPKRQVTLSMAPGLSLVKTSWTDAIRRLR